MSALYKRFLFARVPSGVIVPGGPPAVLVSVDASTKDKALDRLHDRFGHVVPRSAWDFLEELDPEEHSLGRLGEHIEFAERLH